MNQTIIEVRLKDGTVTQFPIENLENFKRLVGHNITGIKPVNQHVPQEDEVDGIVSTSEAPKRRGRKPVNQ